MHFLYARVVCFGLSLIGSFHQLFKENSFDVFLVGKYLYKEKGMLLFDNAPQSTVTP